MIEKLIFGLGFVVFVEGLVLALAPKRLEDIIALISEIPFETRRLLGLSSAIFGAFLIWLANIG